MKIIQLCLLLMYTTSIYAASNYSDTNGATPVNDYFRDFFQDIFNQTVQKILNHVPETIHLTSLNFSCSSPDILSGHLLLSEIGITGMNKLEIRELDASLFGLRFAFTAALPKIELYSKFHTDLIVANIFPVYSHKGRASIVMNDVIIKGTGEGKFGVLDGISLSNLQLVFSIGNTTFDVHGLLDNNSYSLITGTGLHNNLTTFINANEQLISKTVSPLAQGFINKFLQSYNFTDIMSAYKSGLPYNY